MTLVTRRRGSVADTEADAKTTLTQNVNAALQPLQCKEQQDRRNSQCKGVGSPVGQMLLSFTNAARQNMSYLAGAKGKKVGDRR